MNMFFRLFWLMVTAKHRPRVSIWDTAERTYQVRARDLDILRHVTNSATCRSATWAGWTWCCAPACGR